MYNLPRFVSAATIAIAIAIAIAGLASPAGAQPYGPGMMGGQGPGYGMMGGGHGCRGWDGDYGPGMMGGYGPGPMMGGYGRGYYGPANLNLTTDYVKNYLERMIAVQGNTRLKVGDVKEKDGDTIIADIVTKENSLVQRFVVNRHDGFYRPEETQ